MLLPPSSCLSVQLSLFDHAFPHTACTIHAHCPGTAFGTYTACVVGFLMLRLHYDSSLYHVCIYISIISLPMSLTYIPPLSKMRTYICIPWHVITASGTGFYVNLTLQQAWNLLCHLFHLFSPFLMTCLKRKENQYALRLHGVLQQVREIKKTKRTSCHPPNREGSEERKTSL